MARVYGPARASQGQVSSTKSPVYTPSSSSGIHYPGLNMSYYLQPPTIWTDTVCPPRPSLAPLWWQQQQQPYTQPQLPQCLLSRPPWAEDPHIEVPNPVGQFSSFSSAPADVLRARPYRPSKFPVRSESRSCRAMYFNTAPVSERDSLGVERKNNATKIPFQNTEHHHEGIEGGPFAQTPNDERDKWDTRNSECFDELNPSRGISIELPGEDYIIVNGVKYLKLQSSAPTGSNESIIKPQTLKSANGEQDHSEQWESDKPQTENESDTSGTSERQHDSKHRDVPFPVTNVNGRQNSAGNFEEGWDSEDGTKLALGTMEDPIKTPGLFDGRLRRVLIGHRNVYEYWVSESAISRVLPHSERPKIYSYDVGESIHLAGMDPAAFKLLMECIYAGYPNRGSTHVLHGWPLSRAARLFPAASVLNLYDLTDEILKIFRREGELNDFFENVLVVYSAGGACDTFRAFFKDELSRLLSWTPLCCNETLVAWSGYNEECACCWTRHLLTNPNAPALLREDAEVVLGDREFGTIAAEKVAPSVGDQNEVHTEDSHPTKFETYASSGGDVQNLAIYAQSCGMNDLVDNHEPERLRNEVREGEVDGSTKADEASPEIASTNSDETRAAPADKDDELSCSIKLFVANFPEHYGSVRIVKHFLSLLQVPKDGSGVEVSVQWSTDGTRFAHVTYTNMAEAVKGFDKLQGSTLSDAPQLPLYAQWALKDVNRNCANFTSWELENKHETTRPTGNLTAPINLNLAAGDHGKSKWFGIAIRDSDDRCTLKFKAGDHLCNVITPGLFSYFAVEGDSRVIYISGTCNGVSGCFPATFAKIYSRGELDVEEAVLVPVP